MSLFESEPRRRARGFTLIEMMVVLLIIGIMITGAILTLGSASRDSQLEQERDRLAALMNYTHDRGAMLALEFGVRCGAHGYRFTYFDQRTQRWQPEITDDSLRVRNLPAGLEVHLSVEGRDIVLNDKALQFDSRSAPSGPGASTNIPGTLGASGGLGSGVGTAGTSLANSASPTSSSSGGLGSDFNNSKGLQIGVTDNTPQILLYSSGETNVFTLTLVRTGTGHSTTIRSQPDGSIQSGDLIEARL